MTDGDAPAAGWYPDPSGRHQSRYWSGAAWTEHVSDAGTTSVDPIPAAPSGVATDLAQRGRPGTGAVPGWIDEQQVRLDERQARDQQKAAEHARKTELAEAAQQAKQQEKAARRARDEEKAALQKVEREQARAARQAKADEKAAHLARKREEAQAAYTAAAPKRLQSMALGIGIRVKDGFVYAHPIGALSWPAKGSQADLYTKDDRGKRVTLTRVALTGIFALGLQKKTGKLEVIVEISGDGWSVTGRTENIERAHAFVTQWNSTYSNPG